MSRLVYMAFSGGGIGGGHKMIFRHVETLRELGFDATVYTGENCEIPRWFAHTAPVEVAARLHPDDILVVPDDSTDVLAKTLRMNRRVVVFCQNNPTTLITRFTAGLDAFPAEQFPTLMVAAPMLASLYGRLYPQARIGSVPCFADERLFRPLADRRRAVAYTPRKRPQGVSAIKTLLERLHTTEPGLIWRELSGVTEPQVAEAFGSSTLHLSLGRMESVGLTSLEAMAAGCVCTGFLAVGGHAYATPDNGFWAAEDDVEAAAEALGRADELACAGGAPLQRMLDAGRETADRWSYARFREALEVFWMDNAPDARISAGPLG